MDEKDQDKEATVRLTGARRSLSGERRSGRSNSTSLSAACSPFAITKMETRRSWRNTWFVNTCKRG
jgi:hypothetical protein